MESNSTPNCDSIPNKRAIFPSKASNNPAIIIRVPAFKGSFQAQLFSDKMNGRSGRLVIAQKIVPRKTQNFAIASGTRSTLSKPNKQKYYPRVNTKVVIKQNICIIVWHISPCV